MRFRAGALLGVIALLVGGCGGAGSAEPAPTLGVYDQDVVDALVAQGWGEPEAIILATTKVDVVSADDHSAHVVDTFPTGETADLQFSLTPGGPGDPADLEMTREETPDGFVLTLSYHAPRISDLTDLDVGTGDVAIPASLARYTDPRLSLEAPPAADESGGDVVVRVGIQKGAEAVFDSYIEHMQAFLKAEGKLDPFVQSIKSVGSIFEALDQSAKYKKLTARIDAAEECAKNPTNPLTVKAHADDPGTRDRLLQQVDAARLDLKSNVAAAYIAMLNEGLADLSKQAWLGIVVGAGDAWASKTLDELNERSVRDLEASIVKCEEKESPSPTSEETATAPADASPAGPGVSVGAPGSTPAGSVVPQPTSGGEEGPTIHGIISTHGSWDRYRNDLDIDMDFAWVNVRGVTELSVKGGTYKVAVTESGVCPGSGAQSGSMTRGAVNSAWNDAGTVEVRFGADSGGGLKVMVTARFPLVETCPGSGPTESTTLISVSDCVVPGGPTTFDGTCQDRYGIPWNMHFERR